MTLSSAAISDKYDDARVLALPLHSYGAVGRFHGRVSTLRAGSSAAVRAALATPGEGRVLVIEAAEAGNGAIMGSVSANIAYANGWRGIIVSGSVRDVEELSSIGVGVLALGTIPSRAGGSEDAAGGEVTLGGVTILPGQFVYADSDGVLISDRDLTTQ